MTVNPTQLATRVTLPGAGAGEPIGSCRRFSSHSISLIKGIIPRFGSFQTGQTVGADFSQGHGDRVQFGTIQRFNAACDKATSLSKYRPVALEKAYEVMPLMQRRQIDYWNSNITPKDIESMESRQLIGVLEECSDHYFEAQLLRAMDMGILTQERVDALVIPVKGMMERGEPFKQVLAFVCAQYSDADRQAYQGMLGTDNALLARVMLDLSTLKFVLTSIEMGKPVDIRGETTGRQADELEEFIERVPPSALGVVGKSILAFVGRQSREGQPLPLEVPEGLMLTTLNGGNISGRDEMLAYLLSKHLNRCGFEYLSYPKYKSKDRKGLLKPFEVMMEVSLLKDAREGNLSRQVQQTLDAI